MKKAEQIKELWENIDRLTLERQKLLIKLEAFENRLKHQSMRVNVLEAQLASHVEQMGTNPNHIPDNATDPETVTTISVLDMAIALDRHDLEGELLDSSVHQEFQSEVTKYLDTYGTDYFKHESWVKAVEEVLDLQESEESINLDDEPEHVVIEFQSWKRILESCDSKMSDLRILVASDESRQSALQETQGMNRSDLIQLGIENGLFNVKNQEVFEEWNT